MQVIRGTFYEFHAERVISRAGQPLDTRAGIEVGPVISREVALRHVKAGHDVYTLNSEDAYRLALQVTHGTPVQEVPHHPRQASPTGRMDVYFRHYHLGGDHEQFGHISHATKNEGPGPFRAVIVEFADPQGKMKPVGTISHYCNPGSTTACVDEKSLLCTTRMCVEDVSIAPGAVTTKHSHATDHMLVAVSDYELTDEVEGKGTVVRARKSGEVEYIPAGINHRLTNTGQAPAHFTVILWR